MKKTPWEILNIPTDSTAEDIEKAYRIKSNGYEPEEFYIYFDEIYGAYAEAMESVGAPFEDKRAEEFIAGLYIRWENPHCREFIPFWRTVFMSDIFYTLCTDKQFADRLYDFFDKKVMSETTVRFIADMLNEAAEKVQDNQCGRVIDLMKRKLDIIQRTKEPSLKKKMPSYIRQNYEAPVTLGKRIGEYILIAAAAFFIALLYRLTR